MTVRLSSDDIRYKISRAVGHRVAENSRPDGMMSFVKELLNGNAYAVQIGIVEFLAAYYDVSELCISLVWDSSNCSYSAVVSIQDKGGAQ